MSNKRLNAMSDPPVAAHRYVELDRLRSQIAQQVARLAGIAKLAASDIQLVERDDHAISVDCTLTAYQNVRLHELGAAVQLLIGQVVQTATGSEVSVVNVYIRDIDVAPPSPRRRENQFEHG
jgi:uncharacterized alkaline shock family protein YloU